MSSLTYRRPQRIPPISLTPIEEAFTKVTNDPDLVTTDGDTDIDADADSIFGTPRRGTRPLLPPPKYSDVDDAFAGGDRAVRVVDIFGIIHDDLWIMREQIRYLIQIHDPKYLSENPDDHVGEYEAPNCPVCGSRKMIVRPRRDGKGEFWSCIGWPSCNGTMSLAKAKEIADRAKAVAEIESTPGKRNEF